jgi:histidinol-phosphatase (PHP family)
MAGMRDGHTHTHYCRHGSGEPTAAYIERAIALGFDTYTVSEHPPLPATFIARCPYPPGALDEIPMGEDQLDDYVRDMRTLQARYRDRIRVLIGLEVDYLPGDEAWTRALLREYGPFLDDALLSVHFMPGAGGVRCVDMAPTDVVEGLVRHYGGFHAFQRAYYELVLEAVRCDLGPHKPTRIGHLSLCDKFRRRFPEAGEPSPVVEAAIAAVLDEVAARGYALDANMAGLFKELCCQPYPPPDVLAAARARGIPLVYGSDAHAVAEVGRAHDVFVRLGRPDEPGPTPR